MPNTTQGAPTPSVDRTTAHRINPLIGGSFTEDTLDSAARMVSDMGYLLSFIANPPEGTEAEFGSLYLFCNIIAAALSYESQNPCLTGSGLAKQGFRHE